MTAALSSRSDVRAFFTALAFPATAGVLLAFALLTSPRGPLVGLLVNVFVLFEVAGVSQVVRLPMPTDYFSARRFERRWVYDLLGIRVFKRLMRSAIYRRFNPDFRLVDGRRGLDELSQAMRSAELAHAWAFAAVAVTTAGAAAAGWIDAVGWLTLFNVLFNGYPIMLQRYNRLRLEPLLKAGRSPDTLF